MALRSLYLKTIRSLLLARSWSPSTLIGSFPDREPQLHSNYLVLSDPPTEQLSGHS